MPPICLLSLLYLPSMPLACPALSGLPVWAGSVFCILTTCVLSEGTQLLGGTLADKHGGKIVMAYGVIAFSAMSSLMPLAVSQVSMSFSAECGQFRRSCCKIAMQTLPLSHDISVRAEKHKTAGDGTISGIPVDSGIPHCCGLGGRRCTACHE